MKSSIFLLACLISMSVSAQPLGEKPIELDNLQWKYRIILVYAPEPHASRAMANLDELATEIEERHIAWFVLDEDDLHTNYEGKLTDTLRQQIVDRYFTPVPTETSVLLIGKDGTLKSRSTDLDLEATFGLIDQMPMRREELRRARQKSQPE